MYISAPPKINTPDLDNQLSTTPLPKAIYYLGLVSLLTDISSEMVTSILPVFLYSVLLLPALQVAFIDGLYQSAAAVIRLLAAHWAERWQRVKFIAVCGYALSFFAKLLLWLSLNYGFIAVLFSLLLDRLGKGIRTAPRDTLIANQVNHYTLGRAFGVHRTMDAFGALAGPFIASALLAYYNERYDLLFLVSAGFGLLGLLVLSSKVSNSVPSSVPSTLVAKPLVNTDTFQNISLWQRAVIVCKQAAFMRLVIMAVLLNTFTLSDGLFYLSVQQQLNIPNYTVALMFGIAALSFMLSAYLFGKKTDNQGIGFMFAWAYGGLLLIYIAWTIFLNLNNTTNTTINTITNEYFFNFKLSELSEYYRYGIAIFITLLIGLFYGATDGVLIAGLAKECPRQCLTSGLALYTTLLSVAKFLSSLLYGWIWQTYGTTTAFACFTLGLALFSLVSIYFWNKKSNKKLTLTNDSN
jgi:MFS family permease